MDYILLACRIGLALVFAAAGITKLLDYEGTRRSLRDFGVPTYIVKPLSRIIPLAEFTVVGALIPNATAWWGALGALGLLAVFVIAICVNLLRGRTPECHCFGQMHSSPIGWLTVVRNGVLAVVAGVIAVAGRSGPGTSVVSLINGFRATQQMAIGAGAAIVVLAAIQSWFLIHLLQQSGRILSRLELLEQTSRDTEPRRVPEQDRPAAGLPVGSPAPSFKLQGIHGEVITLEALRSAVRPVMLIFSDPLCGPCNSLLPDIGRWQHDQGNKLTLAIISRGSLESNRVKSTEHNLRDIYLQEDREVAQSYLALRTPSAVVVSADGKIESVLSEGAAAVRDLYVTFESKRQSGLLAPMPPLNRDQPTNGNGLRSMPVQPSTVAAPMQAAGLLTGNHAPSISLPDLDGKNVDLAQFRGEKTVILFWNPNCGFCQRMLTDLLTWEAEAASGELKLLIVSTGPAKVNREMGIHSTVVLDQGFSTGRLFGATGTPSAVMIDAEGQVASDVIVGAPAVLNLLRNGKELPLMI